MADALKDVTVLSRGGLFTNEDALALAGSNPGAAVRMLNMEISQFGGYRRISGYADYDSNYGTVSGAGSVIGLWILDGVPYAVRRNLKDTTGTLGTNPFVVTSGSPTITVTHSSHGLVVGDRVTYAGSSAVGGITPNSVEMVIASVVNSNSYTVNFTSNASSGATGGGSSVTFTANGGTPTLGSNPFSVSNTSATITVAHTSHGLVVGNYVTFSGSDAIGGITPNSVEMQVVTVPDANSYTVTFTSAATSTVSGGGGASVTATYSKFYSVWKYTVTGWTTVVSNLSSVNVTKLRHNTNSFTGTEATIICDGANSPSKLSGSTFSVHPTGGDYNPTGASFTTDFKNHQFYAGFPTTGLGPNILLFSEPNDDDAFTNSGGSGNINVGFNITGLAKFRDALYIFGKTKIKKLTGSVKADYVLSEVTDNIGCIATDSIIELGGDVLFLASDGIRPIQGTARIGDVELETVSKPVQQLLQALPSTHNLDNMTSVVIRNKSQFRYFFPKTTTAKADTGGIIGGLRFADRRVGWEFGELLGIRAFVATSGLINDVEVVLHGDLDGEIYQQESGNTFDTGDVTAVYATPFLYFDSTEKRKVFQHITLFTRPEGSSTVNLGIAYDWDDPNVPDPTTYSLTTAGALSRYTTTNSTYDATFTYDGSTSPVLESNIQGSGRAISLAITSTGTQAPYSIAGFSVTYQDAGYR
tara:strand:- start:2719 stop:4815 length:2097 start_codon:yes stop_codon:yes gene_type:complete